MPSAGTFTTRPVYMGMHGMVASGHYLGARAGQRMFDKGGNAIDAAVASGLALNVLEPAIEYTESGFPMYPSLRNAIAGLARRFREEWPSSAAVYLPNNRVPAVGEVLKNPDWAATMKKVVEVEGREKNRGREDAI